MTELYRRRFPATPEAVPVARHEVIDALTHAGLTSAALHANVALAVSEVVGNAVRHAYPPDRIDGHVDVAVTRADDNLTVTISDGGLGMEPRLPTQDSAGLGLAIMSAQAANLAVESDTTGTTVALGFSI
jgi:anti-sigma regulatory factor (Ser/Thr protein kinase)